MSKYKNVLLSIGPPCCGKTNYLKNAYKGEDSIVIKDIDLIDKTDEDLAALNLSKYKTIVIDGLNHTLSIRKLLISQISKCIESIIVKYIYFQISKPSLLYEFFLKKDYKYALPLYMYYDSLDMSGTDGKIVNIISMNPRYNTLLEGSSSVVVNVKTFFVSASNRIHIDVPRDLKRIRLNHKLCNYIRYAYKNGFHIYLSYCPDHQYDHVDMGHVFDIFKMVKKSIDAPVAGAQIDWDQATYLANKPNPWHLFTMMQKFGINPHNTFYMGYGESDRKFADNAGITNFMDCNDTRLLDKVNKSFSYII